MDNNTNTICQKCGKDFKTYQGIKRHINNKKPCVVIGNKDNQNTCLYCKKNYSTPYNLNKHLKTCKMKNGGIEALPNVNRVEEKLRILEEEKKRKDEEIALEREEMQKQLAALQAAFATKLAELECLIALNEL